MLQTVILFNKKNIIDPIAGKYVLLLLAAKQNSTERSRIIFKSVAIKQKVKSQIFRLKISNIIQFRKDVVLLTSLFCFLEQWLFVQTKYLTCVHHLFQPLKCNDLCLDNSIIEPKMSASFVPDHKAPMVLFLDRVYGIDNQDFLLHVLEVGFLPDMRAAASLDTVRFKHL